MKINLKIIIALIMSSNFSLQLNAQPENTQNTHVSFFRPENNIAFLDIKQMEINTPNGKSNTRNYRIKLLNKENNLYSCQIVEISNSKPELYPHSILKTIVIDFKIDSTNHELKIISNLDSIADIFKQNTQQKDLGSTNSFSLFNYPSIIMEVYFNEFLEIIKDFVNADLNLLTRKIEIPNVSDSIPAIQIDKLTKDNNLLLINRSISIDTNAVLTYLYQKSILDKFKNADEATRNSIYNSTSPKDFKQFIKHNYKIQIIGQKLGSIYLIEQISYAFSYNLGNEHNRYVFYAISRSDL